MHLNMFLIPIDLIPTHKFFKNLKQPMKFEIETN